MARTPAQAKSLEAKALAASSKSEGMRTLFEAGYSVSEVRTIFGVPYGFAYGVAKRSNVVESAATRRAPAKAKATKAAAPARAPRAAKPAAAKASKAKRTAARKS